MGVTDNSKHPEDSLTEGESPVQPAKSSAARAAGVGAPDVRHGPSPPAPGSACGGLRQRFLALVAT